MSLQSQVFVRDVLLSTGEIVPEVCFSLGDEEVYESSPSGLTVGTRERPTIAGQFVNIPAIPDFNLDSCSLEEFDQRASSRLGTQLGTPLSLAFLKYTAAMKGYRPNELHRFISEYFGTAAGTPHLICNILNGGKHACNGLAFCEFMIIPSSKSVIESVRIASDIYQDLKRIIERSLGNQSTLVGREGGFAPDIDSIDQALTLIENAIDERHKGKARIAIDVAANNFGVFKNGAFHYTLENKELSTKELVSYYSRLTDSFPIIAYLEDPFHEEDVEGWAAIQPLRNSDVLIVGDDLTVSNAERIDDFRKLINGCILKINQIGDITSLVAAVRKCKIHAMKTILSQRSGETDSNILAHLAVGLGGAYLKAGAPARERIVKYNELIRISGERWT